MEQVKRRTCRRCTSSPPSSRLTAGHFCGAGVAAGFVKPSLDGPGAAGLPLVCSSAGRSNRLAHWGADCGEVLPEVAPLLTPPVLLTEALLAGGGSTALLSRASGSSGAMLGPRSARHVASSATPVSGRSAHACDRCGRQRCSQIGGQYSGHKHELRVR